MRSFPRSIISLCTQGDEGENPENASILLSKLKTELKTFALAFLLDIRFAYGINFFLSS